MALTGSLHDFDLSYIFQIVAQEGKTGRLVLSSGQNEAHVVFERGKIVSAASGAKNLKRALMAYLVDVKRAPYSSVSRLADHLKDDVRSLADHFVNSKHISSSELTRFVEIVLEDLTCELFLWKEGTYRFDVLDKVDTYRINEVALGAEAITMEAARRVDEWERLKPIITPQTVFVLSERAQQESHGGPDADPLDDPCDYLCSLMDGTTSVELLCKRAYLSQYRIYETLSALVQEEWIIPLGDKLSSRINEALRRDVGSRRQAFSDIAVSSLVTLLIVVLMAIISAMVPNSAVRRETDTLERSRRAFLASSQAERKTAIFATYFHATQGYIPKDVAELRRAGMLSRRDVAQNLVLSGSQMSVGVP